MIANKLIETIYDRPKSSRLKPMSKSNIGQLPPKRKAPIHKRITTENDKAKSIVKSSLSKGAAGTKLKCEIPKISVKRKNLGISTTVKQQQLSEHKRRIDEQKRELDQEKLDIERRKKAVEKENSKVMVFKFFNNGLNFIPNKKNLS